MIFCSLFVFGGKCCKLCTEICSFIPIVITRQSTNNGCVKVTMETLSSLYTQVLIVLYVGTDQFNKTASFISYISCTLKWQYKFTSTWTHASFVILFLDTCMPYEWHFIYFRTPAFAHGSNNPDEFDYFSSFNPWWGIDTKYCGEGDDSDIGDHYFVICDDDDDD